MLVKHHINASLNWIETRKLNEREKNTLLDEYKISDEVLEYVLDTYEQSNYIHEPEDEQDLVILHMPAKSQENNRYTTKPIAFLIKENNLFTFNESNLSLMNHDMNKETGQERIDTPVSFMLEKIYFLMSSYFPVLREVTRQRHVLDDMLTKKLTNKELVKLAYLQQSLTFILNAAESNVEALTILEKSKFGKELSDVEKERLEDALIEAEQIVHMAELEAKIVDKIAKIFDSIMNNNLNDTMKFLTVWSLAIAIPTLITGFFGMNINLPKVDKVYGWIQLTILSVVLVAWLILGLKRNKKV
ncbi:magnesium transporter CorA family protein [Vagococcus fluvialis]|uniref:Magnesium transporter CorA family protein n=1 Tax=Vagococcus fluvialis TaxID=2738 RepID=A0A7X6I2J2_9ENTE|nr:magnesium transporter CorA family protein [Vagococcus fluvialis]MBO0442920.1 magnesium transporter CorA family protein [Vagococcus fluvialis]MCM2139537.1 magnesium transporter CorA family protein [Vagococcus fluvialis]MDT2746147.1 magnesium transporter CorA family protein [Vagococcus fluvialis]NKC58387.1 magnesium transporter CorA family protein [Vagococcus fluvialis]NKC67476.1 magnesium transporter CorA family protein [Vagococcus fluvialis]